MWSEASLRRRFQPSNTKIAFEPCQASAWHLKIGELHGDLFADRHARRRGEITLFEFSNSMSSSYLPTSGVKEATADDAESNLTVSVAFRLRIPTLPSRKILTSTANPESAADCEIALGSRHQRCLKESTVNG